MPPSQPLKLMLGIQETLLNPRSESVIMRCPGLIQERRKLAFDLLADVPQSGIAVTGAHIRVGSFQLD